MSDGLSGDTAGSPSRPGGDAVLLFPGALVQLITTEDGKTSMNIAALGHLSARGPHAAARGGGLRAGCLDQKERHDPITDVSADQPS